MSVIHLSYCMFHSHDAVVHTGNHSIHLSMLLKTKMTASPTASLMFTRHSYPLSLHSHIFTLILFLLHSFSHYVLITPRLLLISVLFLVLSLLFILFLIHTLSYSYSCLYCFSLSYSLLYAVSWQ
ncbi:MAG: hypothetical protein NXY57DRAFT_1032961 [Lentinula lateritia]|nr:MAG: hypothetical protein NXY57DRAFT_1032961 [Lentinula lateritia]